MSRSRLVIGVIGGNGAQAVAHSLGRAIALSGHAVLTGGRPILSGEVKDAALLGAANAAGRLRVVARIVGILCSEEPTLEMSLTPPVMTLFLSTGLSSPERDVITGVTPDVLLVLCGGTGTLTEAAFAHLLHRPILLVNSRQHLRAKLKEHRPSGPLFGGDGKLDEYLCQAIAAYPTVNGIVANKALLEMGLEAELDHAEEYPEEKIDSVIERAIALAMAAGFTETPVFPGLPRDPTVADKFKRGLDAMLSNTVGERDD